MIRQLKDLISEYRSLQPLNEETAKKLDQKFRLEFNFNSNHLEGNTLTYGETKLLLLFDQVKSNHEMRELQEMKAHDVALAFIKQEAEDRDKPLTQGFIRELNGIILVQDFWKDAITPDGSTTRRKIRVGQYKEYPNSVIQSNGEVFEYASPQETPIMMGELVEWYNTEATKDDFTPIELAALLHYRYIRIHPFDDGNGRVARLLVNYVLYKNDLPPVIIKTDDKKNYLRALQHADAGDTKAFIDYMVNQLAWSVDLSIRAAKGENIEEQNDWEKQLSVLKKGLGDKGNPVIKRSEEAVKNIFENVIVPFATLYEEKMSQFESLFMSSKYIISSFSSKKKTITEDTLKNFISLISLHNIIHLEIGNEFRSLRNPYNDERINTIRVGFIFEDNVYIVGYNDFLLSKLYNEYLSEEDINEIISAVAKDLLVKIETLAQS